ncbi:putative kinase mug58 [Smittium mucronatum]|uniref:Putative kinase mug58 n=1 Tax=Smittium mucronatum TaxID=133383 RepID=A0A1R0GNF6_9FUNG|nr:putative kinase mug58 [Smittium mucronatum]
MENPNSDKIKILTEFILKTHKSHSVGSKDTLIVGLSGPQGSGKTTICADLISSLHQNGLIATTFSTDDVYIPFSEQVGNAEKYPGNRLVEFRGNAGTVHVDLAVDTLNKLKRMNETGEMVSIPIFNKSLNGGRGDRLPEAEWRKVGPRLDVVLFEGWNLGFPPVPREQVTEICSLIKSRSGPLLPISSNPNETDYHLGTSLNNGYRASSKFSEPELQLINSLISSHSAMYNMLDAFIHFRAASLEYIYEWRWQQEQALAISVANSNASKSAGTLTKQQVIDFVDRFMPCYEINGAQLVRVGFVPSSTSQISLLLDANRKIISP